jgi:hypothetical protein
VSDLDWWGPTWAALSCILDMMPREQRVATLEQLKLMAQACENKGARISPFMTRREKAVHLDMPCAIAASFAMPAMLLSW